MLQVLILFTECSFKHLCARSRITEPCMHIKQEQCKQTWFLIITTMAHFTSQGKLNWCYWFKLFMELFARDIVTIHSLPIRQHIIWLTSYLVMKQIKVNVYYLLPNYNTTSFIPLRSKAFPCHCVHYLRH